MRGSSNSEPRDNISLAFAMWPISSVHQSGLQTLIFVQYIYLTEGPMLELPQQLHWLHCDEVKGNIFLSVTENDSTGLKFLIDSLF